MKKWYYSELNVYNKKRQLKKNFCDTDAYGLIYRLLIVLAHEGISNTQELIYNTYLKEDAEKIIKLLNLYLLMNFEKK